MDYCLLEDAFKGTISTEKQRKHERKQKKRHKDMIKMLDPNFNPQDFDTECPANLQPKLISEAFQDISANIPKVSKDALKPLPSYFTGGYDEEETFSDFTKTDEKGFDKATGKDLTLPNIEDSWKPMTPSNNNTAYFDSLPTPGGTYPVWNRVSLEEEVHQRKQDSKKQNSKSQDTKCDTTDLQLKIDELKIRLDMLEKENTKEANQMEILAFVGTGLFMILSLSLLK